MNLEKWKPLFYPLTLWIAYKILAFLFGFTPWPDISTVALLGFNQTAATALGFGIWIGAVCYKNFKFGETLRNALVFGVIIGFIEFLLTLILINSSSSFVSYAISYLYNNGIQYGGSPLLNTFPNPQPL